MPEHGQTEANKDGASSGFSVSAWFANVFPKGEARSVNVGTEKKPCWVLEGPEPSAADREWAAEIVNTLHPRNENKTNV